MTEETQTEEAPTEVVATVEEVNEEPKVEEVKEEPNVEEVKEEPKVEEVKEEPVAEEPKEEPVAEETPQAVKSPFDAIKLHTHLNY